MAGNLRDILRRVYFKKKIFALITIILIIGIALNLNIKYPKPVGSVIGETGAPPNNGTTSEAWIINSTDIIIRSNENISTKYIQINSSGAMNWRNVSAEVHGDILIESNAFFYITDCNLTLTGNLTVNGIMNVVNSTILVNCSINDQFFISIERAGFGNGGTFSITAGSDITSPANDTRIRVLWADRWSNLTIENTTMSHIGWNAKRSGLRIESDDTTIRNSTFFNCFNALTLSYTTGVFIEDCEFTGCHFGINFTNATDSEIKNCTFRTNDCGIFSEYSSLGLVSECNFIDNRLHGIYLSNNNYDNKLKNSLFDNNSVNGIYIETQIFNTNISNCTISNSSYAGIFCKDNVTNTTIINCTFNDNGFSLRFENESKDSTIINSTVKYSKNLDFYLANNSKLSTLNTTFTPNKVQVVTGSNLTVDWFLHIIVYNSTFVALPEVNITITDNDNGSFELNTTTDDHGWVRWVVCTEFYETEVNRTYLTPHTIQGHKYGYDKNITQLIMNSSKILNITLNQTQQFAPDLVPIRITFLKEYPKRNQEISIDAEIMNVGNENYNNNTNVSVSFFADDLLINRTTNLPSIPINNFTTVTIQWKVNVSNGTHNISVYIDMEKNLTELNNTNNSLSKMITVNSIPLAILKVDPSTAQTYEEIMFDATESFNEVSLVPIQSYLFDFGDGMVSGWINTPTISHNYTENGTYYALLSVRDISGQTSAWSEVLEIVITNRAPTADFLITPPSGTINTEFEFNPMLSIAMDGTITKYYWNVTDGMNSTEEILTHKFDDDIEYNISLIVWDNDGAMSEVTTKKIEIKNLPPIAIFNVSNDNPMVFEDILFNATGSRDIDDTLSISDFTWDFDDGTFGYETDIIQHNFSEPGVYNVTLYVLDDDFEAGIYWMLITVNETLIEPEDSSTDDLNLLWVVALVVIVLVIFFVLIMLLFLIQSKKLRKQLATEEQTAEFTTAGKLDFVILKKPIGKRYVKFELHRTTKSNNEFLGIIWRSAFLDTSWVPMEKQLDTKDKVIDYLQLKILVYNNKNWAIDYSGNGTILSKSSAIQPPLPSSAPGTQEPSVQLEPAPPTPPEPSDEKKEDT
jgi:parallel beta-helix repeat protein